MCDAVPDADAARPAPVHEVSSPFSLSSSAICPSTVTRDSSATCSHLEPNPVYTHPLQLL